MDAHRHRILFAALSLTLAAAAGRAQTFTEGFTTTTYKDEVETTADWNTAVGELRLPPFTPSLAGEYNTPGAANDVAVDGDFAYVADGNSGLKILDISDLSAPVLIGDYDTPGLAFGVDVAGDLVFVADGVNGLLVFDVLNPASPVLRGSYDTPGSAVGVDIEGNTLYVADGPSGLQIFDVSNPAAPTLVGNFDTPGTARVVQVVADLAYIADQAGGLQIVDVSNLANPTFVGSYIPASGARGVAVDGNVAYLAAFNDGVLRINIVNPASPSLLGSFATPGQAIGVAVSGQRVFVADGVSGLQVIKLGPLQQAVVGEYNTPGNAQQVVPAGAHAFVADLQRGLQIIETSVVVDPVEVGSHTDQYLDVRDVAVQGNLAFAVDADLDRILMFNMFNTYIQSITSLSTVGTPRHVELEGKLLLISTNVGLEIATLDCCPLDINALASYPVASRSSVLDGDLAYVAAAGTGLLVLDLSDPANPTLVGSYNTPGSASDVKVAGDHVYVADSSAGLLVFDIDDPSNPILVGSYDTAGLAIELAISGHHAYVADYDAGLAVVDISDAYNPTLVETYSTSGYLYSVSVSGDIAAASVVETSNSRMLLFDISDPTSVSLLGTKSQRIPYSVELDGHYAYIADGNLGGIELVQVLQDEAGLSSAAGQSLPVSTGEKTIVRARLGTTQSGGNGISWGLSVGAGSFEAATPDSWLELSTPASMLRWRSTLEWSPAVNPIVSELDLEWLFDTGPIVSIEDVPDDQGGRVYLKLGRSGYDFAAEAETPATQYGVYRRVDNLSKSGLASYVLEHHALPGEAVFLVGEVPHVVAKAGSSFPPGTWALVNTVPATQSDEYLVEATTAADADLSGPNESIFVVTTHTTTPSVWFASEPDSGSSVDNLAPGVPTSIIATYQESGVELDWDDAPENDFQAFRIYRGNDSDFIPSAGNLLVETSSSAYTDASATPWGYHYKVASIDHAGNESPAGSPDSATGVSDGVPALQFALHDAVPNPFNPATKISFSLPSRGHVDLAVYDVQGRRVATLVDEQLPPGAHDVVWRGRDRQGRSVASGVYFYRIDVGSQVQTKRMVLLK